MRTLIRSRHVAWSVVLGTMLVLLCFSLSESGELGSLSRLLLMPGAAMAEVLGVGAHDFAGLLLYVLGNVVFYSLVPMLIFVFLESRKA